MTNRIHARVIGIAAGLTLLTPLAEAHDIKGLTVEANKGASAEVAMALTTMPTADESTKWVLNNLLLWPIPRKLTICFHGGTNVLRKRVTDAMQKLWPIGDLSQGRLDYDKTNFSNPP